MGEPGVDRWRQGALNVRPSTPMTWTNDGIRPNLCYTLLGTLMKPLLESGRLVRRALNA